MGGTVGFLWPIRGPIGGRAEATIHPKYFLWVTFLGLVFILLLWATRRWRAQKTERRRREVAEENRRKACSLYEEAFGGGDLSVVDEVVGEAFFDHRQGHRSPQGLKRVIVEMRHTFPDLRVSVEEQGTEGDTVTTRCVLHGTDRGGLLWYPPTGRRATFAAKYTDRFSDGILVEHWGESDTGSLLEQLGLPPREG
jgi:predicted ester cyclase